MSDDTKDDNVTQLPNNGQQKKPKKAKDILAEIKGEEKQERAKAFKNSLKARVAEVEKLKKVWEDAQKLLDEEMKEFDDANS